MLSSDLISDQPLNFLDSPSDDENQIPTPISNPKPPKKRRMEFDLGAGSEIKEIEEEDDHSFANHLNHMEEEIKKIGDEIEPGSMAPNLPSYKKGLQPISDCTNEFLKDFEEKLRRNKYYKFWEAFVGGLREVTVSAILEPTNYNSSGLKNDELLKKLEELRKRTGGLKEQIEVYEKKANLLNEQMKEAREIAKRIEETAEPSRQGAKEIIFARRYLVALNTIELIEHLRDLKGTIDEKIVERLYLYINVLEGGDFDRRFQEYISTNELEKDQAMKIRWYYVIWYVRSNFDKIIRIEEDSLLDEEKPIEELLEEYEKKDMTHWFDVLKNKTEDINIRQDLAWLKKTFISRTEDFIFNFNRTTKQNLELEGENEKEVAINFIETVTDWIESRYSVRVAKIEDYKNLREKVAEMKKEASFFRDSEKDICDFKELQNSFSTSLNPDEKLDVLPEYETAVDEALLDVRLAIRSLHNAQKETLMLHPDLFISFAGLAQYHYFTKVILRYPRRWRPVRTIEDMKKDVTRYIAMMARYETLGSRGKTIRRIG